MKKRYGENKVNITLWTLTVISALVLSCILSAQGYTHAMEWVKCRLVCR